MNNLILIKGGLIVCDDVTAPTQGDILIGNGVIMDIGVSINTPANAVCFI
jgi:hypothetical protein